MVQWAGILDKFVSLYSLNLKDNTMNEYVDYYKEHCLNILKGKVKNSKGEVVEIQGEIILNDIGQIDYEQAVNFAQLITVGEGGQHLSENVFARDTILQATIGNLNARKLWRLSVLLYTMIAKYPVAKIKPSLIDEYLKLYRIFTLTQNKVDVSAIEFKCTIDGKTKNVTIKNEELLEKVLLSYLNMQNDIITPDTLRRYEVNEIVPIDKLVDESVNKRTLDYYFAIELESFLTSYLNGKFTDKEKELIQQILYLFGRYKTRSMDATTRYRKLMSDGKKLLLNIHAIVINETFMPFTIIPNPEATKLRNEYIRYIIQCENENNSSIHI